MHHLVTQIKNRRTALYISVVALLSIVCIFSCTGKSAANINSTGDAQTFVLTPIPAGQKVEGGADEVLKVGAARTDITPTKSVPMGGYGVYFLSKKNCRWSTGVHDPLYANAVFFSKGDSSLLLVSMDLVGLIYMDVDEIRKEIAAKIPIDASRIIITASHTHASPDTIGLWGTILPPSSGRDEAYMKFMKQRAVEAAVLAYQAKKTATLSWAKGQLSDQHFNTYDAQVQNAPIDHTLTVLKAVDENDLPITWLVNWGCHPTTEGMDNLQYSSDWVGGFYHWMKKETGGLPVFVQGSIGAAIQPSEPWRDKNLHSEGQGFIWADAMGRKVTEAVLALDRYMQEVEFDSIEVSAMEISFPMTNRVYRIAGRLGVIPFEIPEMGEMLSSQVTQVRMGPFRMATTPGEIAAQLGQQVREVTGGDAQFVIGLGNDWLGYVIDPDQYNDKTYAYEKMLCPGPELGPGVVAAHKKLAESVR